MSVFTKIKNMYKRATPKQLMLGGVFALAFAAAIGGGFASKGLSSALSGVRDCGYEGNGVYNSIDYKSINGGCGALSREELIADLRDNNPGDLQTIYADSSIGLPTNLYDDFAAHAEQGYITKSGGNVVVDGQTVMTDVWTMGRTTLGGSQRTPISIGGHTYYHSPTSISFGPSTLDAMVLFDKDGTVQSVIMNSCGNPVTQGHKIPTGATCDKLDKFPVDGKENTYKFSAHATPSNSLAKIVKYDFYTNDGSGDKLFDTTTNADELTKEVTFTKASTVTVKVTISIPGHQTKVITSTLCAKQIGVVKKEVLHVCDLLTPSTSDNITFRFTVHTKQSNGVTVKNADFTTDGTLTAASVTKTDADGNIIFDQTFSDAVKHTVAVRQVTFVVDGKDVVVVTPKGDCQAQVTPQQKCVPKAGEDKNCQPICVPTATQDQNCKELPKTGPAGMTGLFAGVSGVGAVLHRVYTSRRNRRG